MPAGFSNQSVLANIGYKMLYISFYQPLPPGGQAVKFSCVCAF
jgi:hypothetical protein